MYEVLEKLGEGSFATVFRGRRRFTGQIVALKSVSFAGKSSEDVAALRREIGVHARLDHDNIVRLLDFYETPTHVVLVTEFCHGELLAILTEDGALPEPVVRSVASQLVAALRYLASHGIMHRDLKPQNLLVASNGVVKLADFGFAREVGVASSGGGAGAQQHRASVKGTPYYMSPEMLKGAPYDARSDVWGACVLLYELACGAPLFASARTFADLVNAIVANAPITLPGAFSPDFRAFLECGLRRKPEERASWDELAAHPWLQTEGTPVVAGGHPPM